MNSYCTQAYRILKLTFGISSLIAGFDKFFNYLTPWMQWISPLVSNFIPINLTYLLYGLGIVEIIIGLMILFYHTKTGAYALAFWMFAFTANYISMGRYPIALRDLVIGFSALAFASLARAACGCSKEK